MTDEGHAARMARTGFGTSGVRALVSDLTSDVVGAYVLAFCGWLEDKRLAAPGTRIVIGNDLRPSSPDIAAAAAAAVVQSGYDFQYCGPIATPAIAFHALRLGVPAIVITGSHIPFDRNGVKFYRPDGEILKADEMDIVSNVKRYSGLACGLKPLSTLPAIDQSAEEAYISRYVSYFGGRILAEKRIGIFQHSSVARDLLVRLFETMGADTVPIGRSDSFVAVDTEAVGEYDQDRATRWAREIGFDVLVSTDGDGDRPLIGDETGTFFRGDAVGILTARQLGIRTVVTPVSTNTALEKSGWFDAVERTRIGSPYVIEAMSAQTAHGSPQPVAGFEANGGFLLASPVDFGSGRLDPLPTRDSVLPMLALMAMAKQAGKPMSALHALLPPRYTASDRLQDVEPARARSFLDGLTDRTVADNFLRRMGLECQAVDLTDGVRMTAVNGEIVHLRMSGNAPEMRCYAESDSPARSAELARQALSTVAEEL